MDSDSPPTSTGSNVFVIVAAHNEADRLGRTLKALAEAFPGAPVWVADDGSSDETAAIAQAEGARVVHSAREARRRSGGVGKGGAVTLAAREALREIEPARSAARSGERAGGTLNAESVAVLCDGDLGDSAALLGALVESVRHGEADLAVAAFARRVGGGFRVAVGFAGWAIRRRCGLVLRAPISGQRALRGDMLAQILPFAHGFGMEIGMTIDVARAGARVKEIDLDLSHRATGKTPAGFLHRGRQLVDFVRVYLARR